MASVTAFIRVSKKRIERANVRFRLRDGRNVQLFHTSELEVNPSDWDATRQEIKAKVLYDPEKRAAFNKAVADRKNMILETYNAVSGKEGLTSELLDQEIDKRLHPDRYIVEQPRQTFFEAYEEFIEKRKLSDWRVRAIQVVIRALKRYELYARRNVDRRFTLDLDTVTPLVLGDFEEFLRNEHTFCEQYPEIYEAVPESRTPQPRGQNTINGILTKLRTFFIWANDVGKTTNNPFKNYIVEECVYGTPIYITIDERNKLYHTPMPSRRLETVRDIFVFQCLIGCRVGDLVKMKPQNIVRGAIEYIPHKTKDGRPETVRVPLNDTAKEIIAKYADYAGPSLFPLMAEQQYNKAIKRIFLAAGMKRRVTILNPLTREAEQRPIWEVASSHLARRAFVGNLYKQVKDPNLVGALSGHKEGSRAFARYRDIDEEMKTELVKMLE